MTCGKAAVLLAMVPALMVSCAAPTATTAPPTATPPTAATTTIPPSTVPAANLIVQDELSGLPVDVYGPVPQGEGRVVVLFHGGGWFGGDPASMAALADYLAGQGFVVFNATYRTSTGGFPESFDDVACALRYATSAAGEFTSHVGPLAVVAHSAGAHLAAVAVLAGGLFGGECPVADEVTVDRFVGLAGPYDPTLYSVALASYYGTRLEDDPAPWEAGSPYTYLGRGMAGRLSVLLIHGGADDLVPAASSALLEEAMRGAGYDVTLQVLAGASHADVRDPAVVGETVAGFLEPTVRSP